MSEYAEYRVIAKDSEYNITSLAYRGPDRDYAVAAVERENKRIEKLGCSTGFYTIESRTVTDWEVDE